MSHRAVRVVICVLPAACGLIPAVAQERAPEYEQGVTVRFYDIQRPIDHLAPLRDAQTPNVDVLMPTLNLPGDAAFPLSDYFIVEAEAQLVVSAPRGKDAVPLAYDFRLTSDDGSRLWIDGRLIIDNDGTHAMTPKTGSIDLVPGQHRLRVQMFENAGQAGLVLEWRPPGAREFALIPSEHLRVEKGITRVTSPGRKVLLDGREHIRPGDGMPLEGVHPGWVVERLRPDGFEPKVGAMDFLPDPTGEYPDGGSLIIAQFEPANNGVLRERPNGSVWRVRGVLNKDWTQTTVEQIAGELHDPSGLVCVPRADDPAAPADIYISHRPGIVRLRDMDSDGTYETRETFAEPWQGTNYHHFSFGLQHHKGWIYGTLSTSIYFSNTLDHDNVRGDVIGMNGPNPPNRGTCYRINVETREVEFLAGGFRTPNGILVTPYGDIFVSDNQGAWMPSNRLNHVQPGHFYGHYNGLQSSDLFPGGGARSLNMEHGESPPMVWLPQNEISNSPTTPLLITDGPFADQLLLAELTAGGIRRVYRDYVNGQFQGAVFRFTQGLECGVNRLIWGPDGCLYAGGIGADGNWNWKGTQFGLQRLRPTGEEVLEYLSISATPDGFIIRFTIPISLRWLRDESNYTIRQWGYLPTPDYGGAKQREQQLVVSSAIPGADQRSVRLVVPGLVDGSVVYFRCDPKSVFNHAMWSTEAWYTLNERPKFKSVFFDPHRTEIFAEEEARMPSPGVYREPQTGWSRGRNAESGDEWLSNRGATGRVDDLVSVFEHGDADIWLRYGCRERSPLNISLQERYLLTVDAEESVESHTLEVRFRAPRFDPLGNKISDARFERVSSDGMVTQPGPRFGAPSPGGLDGEVAFGPLRVKGDTADLVIEELKITPLPYPRPPSVAPPDEIKKLRVLVFSKTAGFRHDSIADGIACIKSLAREHGFSVTATEEASAFTNENLKNFDLVVFLNTTGDVLNEDQQRTLQNWYKAGKGFVGVHSAADTEYDWAWYGELVGAYFKSHPAIQPARVIVNTREHPSTAHLGDTWTRTDEWYDYRASPRAGNRLLLSLDQYTFTGSATTGAHPVAHPISWCREFDGGRTFYTGGGHTKESYSEPAFRAHLLGGMLWAAGLADE